jgi:hypothetical protein
MIDKLKNIDSFNKINELANYIREKKIELPNIDSAERLYYLEKLLPTKVKLSKFTYHLKSKLEAYNISRFCPKDTQTLLIGRKIIPTLEILPINSLSFIPDQLEQWATELLGYDTHFLSLKGISKTLFKKQNLPTSYTVIIKDLLQSEAQELYQDILDLVLESRSKRLILVDNFNCRRSKFILIKQKKLNCEYKLQHIEFMSLKEASLPPKYRNQRFLVYDFIN